MKNHFIAGLLLGAFALPAAADVNRGDVRIAWNHSTFQEMTSSPVCNADYKEEPNLYYPRAKHLSDGSILLTFENDHFGWDIYARKSFDGGKTWTDACLIRHSHPAVSTVGEDMKVFVNPDFCQLKSGRILLAWQWRYKAGYSDLPNTNKNCGIELVWSDDLGKSWSEPVEVYRGRCWEPAFLELPSGEIHMYITDSQEIRNKGSYACTSIIRSLDGGKTWQGKPMALHTDMEPITRTKWHGHGMDGMPTAVLLDDGKTIVVPLETWSGRDVYDISPIVVRSSNNWDVDGAAIRENGGPEFPAKKQVNKDLKAFGPYSCKLSTGEMVILTNGRYKDQNGVFALIGDRNGDNFSYVTTAFPVPGAYWGSIDLINPNELMATCTVRSAAGPMPAAGDAAARTPKNRGKILLIQGWLNRSRTITAGELKMQNLPEFNPDGLWMLGKKFPSKVYADFGYDRNNFYFGSYVFDANIVSHSPENSDAGQILLSRGKRGTYKITVNAKGDYTIYKEVNCSWKLLVWEEGKIETSVIGSVNDDKDTDLGYSARLPIEWSLLGGKPSKGEQLRIHQRHYYKSGVKVKAGLSVEDTEGENSDYPGEWLTVTLK